MLNVRRRCTGSKGGHKKVCKSKHPPMVEKWAAKCPRRMIPNGETASSWMAKMGITDELLAGSGRCLSGIGRS